MFSTLNYNGKELNLDSPRVMGIVNITNDSFFEGSRFADSTKVLSYVEKNIKNGMDIIDIGGMSSRPGAKEIDWKEELALILPIVKAVRTEFPDLWISVDTYRKDIAKAVIDEGVDMINDITGGQKDAELWNFVAQKDIPYVLMHMKGMPLNMQDKPQYDNISFDILQHFIKAIKKLRKLGQKQIIVDPGFGFGKTVSHNYELLNKLKVFKILDVPIMIGLSRKSMIHKVLDISAEEALNGTTALHMVALQQGVQILRAHDVREAWETIQLYEQLKG